MKETILRIEGFDFRHVEDVKPEQGYLGAITQYMPQDKYANIKNHPLNNYGTGPFCKFMINKQCRASGVYLILVDDEVLYVGECTNLSKRFNMGYGNISPRNCYRGGQETNCRINHLICKSVCAGNKIALFFLQTPDYKKIEAGLRAELRPRWNRC